MDMNQPCNLGIWTLSFSHEGNWNRLQAFGTELLAESGDSLGMALQVDGCGKVQLRFVEIKAMNSMEQECAGIELLYDAELHFGEGDVQHVQLKQTFEWIAEQDCLRRSLRVVRGCADNGEPRREICLRSASLLVDGMVLGSAEDTLVSVPMGRVIPGTPWREMASRTGLGEAGGQLEFIVSAPDAISGTVAMEQAQQGAQPALHAAVTPLPPDCPVHLFLYGGGQGQLVVEHRFGCESYLDAESEHDLACQVFHVSRGPWQAFSRRIGRFLAEKGLYTPPVDRPAWAKNAVVYECDLQHHGGIKGLVSRLDEIQAWGFNTVYLMPWHLGGYGTDDYLRVDPALGTEEDLIRLSGEVHRRGMKLLYDLLVNIASEQSPYYADHPDWFYQDSEGNILKHPTWGGPCLDPASQGFRHFLIRYAVKCCTKWGADGFRVDAAAYRGGLWERRLGLQPYEHAHAVFTLVGDIRLALREVHPEAILMAECFGPLQVPISDLVCFQWIAWLDWALSGLLEGWLNGAQLSRLIGEHYGVMPAGTWFTNYTHTHDTVAFEQRDLDGPPVAALFTALTLLGAGVMVFGGGWGMRQRPNREEQESFASLFHFKQTAGGVSGHEVTFLDEADPELLSAERPSLMGPIRVITHFGTEKKYLPDLPDDAEVVYSRLGSHKGEIMPYDTVVVRM